MPAFVVTVEAVADLRGHIVSRRLFLGTLPRRFGCWLAGPAKPMARPQGCLGLYLLPWRPRADEQLLFGFADLIQKSLGGSRPLIAVELIYHTHESFLESFHVWARKGFPLRQLAAFPGGKRDLI
jgi:hypothetical protein